MCVQGQQYRWLSGPMQVIKKSIGITWSSKVWGERAEGSSCHSMNQPRPCCMHAQSIGVLSKLSATYFFVRYLISGCERGLLGCAGAGRQDRSEVRYLPDQRM